jgi:CubicO group peptidase (beta-lactamase class C family)
MLTTVKTGFFQQSGGWLAVRSLSNKLAVALVLVSTLTAPSWAAAQAGLPPRIATLDDSVRRLIPADAPGIAIGIVRNGEVLHTLYVGQADLSSRAPIDEASRFNIASTGKQFTAAVVLSLVQDGRLSLDATVRSLLPSALPAVDAGVTVRQLLTHTSGLRDVYDLWSLAGITWWREPVGNREALALLARQRDLNFAPSSQYLYSNSNYILLTEIVRAVTDSSFAAVSAQRFRTWGLPATTFQTDASEPFPGRVRPYGGGKRWQEYPTIAAVHGDGGLYTTLPDQLAWEVRLQRTATSGSATALERVSQTPIVGAPFTNYGYGVEFGTYLGMPYTFHDGNTGAFNATFVRFPNTGVSVVAMSNNGTLGVRALALRYAESLLGNTVATTPYPSRPANVGRAEDVTPWLGDYRAATGALISLAISDSGLVRRIHGAPDVRLLADTGNVYRYANNAALKMALDHDASGEPRFTIYLPTQEPNVGRRLPPAPPPIPAAAWTGQFVNAETGATIGISTITGTNVTGALNGSAFTGALVRSNVLTAGGYECTAVLGADGRVDTLLLDGERIKRVAFRRAP